MRILYNSIIMQSTHRHNGVNKMMEMHEIREALKDRKLLMVAEATGMHYNTIRAYANGTIKRPSVDVVKRLSDYLSK